MKIIHQLLDFMESYDMAEANAKKICKELIERKFMKQPVIIKPTFADLPATIALFDKRKHRSLIGKGNVIKTCPQCGQRYKTYFGEQRFCSRKCFGKAKSAEATARATEIKPSVSNDKLWKPR